MISAGLRFAYREASHAARYGSVGAVVGALSGTGQEAIQRAVLGAKLGAVRGVVGRLAVHTITNVHPGIGAGFAKLLYLNSSFEKVAVPTVVLCSLACTVTLSPSVLACACVIRGIALNILVGSEAFWTGFAALGTVGYTIMYAPDALYKIVCMIRGVEPYDRLREWPFPTELPLYSTWKGASVPPEAQDVLGLPEPAVSWREVAHWDGCGDFYRRLSNERDVVAANGENYYPRIRKYTGYLLTHARDNPEDADVIRLLFQETQGRCGGIIQDIENAYYLYCLRSNQTTLPAFLSRLGWETRQEQFAGYVQGRDVHEVSSLRTVGASSMGLLPPAEPDTLAFGVIRSTRDQCIRTVMENYCIRFINALYDDAKSEAPIAGARDLRFRLRDADGSLVSQKIFDDMAVNGIYPSQFTESLRERLQTAQAIAANFLEYPEDAADRTELNQAEADLAEARNVLNVLRGNENSSPDARKAAQAAFITAQRNQQGAAQRFREAQAQLPPRDPVRDEWRGLTGNACELEEFLQITAEDLLPTSRRRRADDPLAAPIQALRSTMYYSVFRERLSERLLCDYLVASDMMTSSLWRRFFV